MVKTQPNRQPPLLTDNAGGYKIEERRYDYRNKEVIEQLVKENIEDAKRAIYLKEKAENKTLTKDELIEVIHKVFCILEDMPLKFLSLYQGAYRQTLQAIFKNYSECYIAELFENYENKALSEIFQVALEKVRRGEEGTRGFVNVMNGLLKLGELIQRGQNKQLYSEQGIDDVPRTRIVVNNTYSSL